MYYIISYIKPHIVSHMVSHKVKHNVYVYVCVYIFVCMYVLILHYHCCNEGVLMRVLQFEFALEVLHWKYCTGSLAMSVLYG